MASSLQDAFALENSSQIADQHRYHDRKIIEFDRLKVLILPAQLGIHAFYEA